MIWLAFLFLLVPVESWAQTAVSWWVAPYVRADEYGRVVRVCKIEQYASLIAAEGGSYRAAEILGGYCVAKVRANAAAVTALAADADLQRLPKDRIDDPLSTLTNQQKTRLRNFILSLGYTAQEVQARFPNDLGTYTLRDVLRFMATRRLKPRYDSAADTIVLDGPIQPVKSPDTLDEAIK